MPDGTRRGTVYRGSLGSSQHKSHRPCCAEGTWKLVCLEQSEQRSEGSGSQGRTDRKCRNEQMNTRVMAWEEEETRDQYSGLLGM